jgi:hypothetical protein
MALPVGPKMSPEAAGGPDGALERGPLVQQIDKCIKYMYVNIWTPRIASH